MKNKKNIYNNLTKLILIVVIIQNPIIYYYSSGLIVFLLIPLIFIEFIIFFWLFVVIIRDDFGLSTKLQKRGLLIAVLIFVFSITYSEQTIEYLDWHIRRSSREEIVNLIKNKKIKTNIKYRNRVILLEKWNLPPISNGGNEILVDYYSDNKITVEFFINRGFLDHYSEFVYTNSLQKINNLNEHIKYTKSDKSLNYKIDNNWYRVSY